MIDRLSMQIDILNKNNHQLEAELEKIDRNPLE